MCRRVFISQLVSWSFKGPQKCIQFQKAVACGSETGLCSYECRALVQSRTHFYVSVRVWIRLGHITCRSGFGSDEEKPHPRLICPNTLQTCALGTIISLWPSPPPVPKCKYQTSLIFRILCWAASNRSSTKANEKGQSCTFTALAVESRYTRLLSQDFSHIYFFSSPVCRCKPAQLADGVDHPPHLFLKFWSHVWPRECLWDLWNRHFKIVTTNGRCAVSCSGQIVSSVCLMDYMSLRLRSGTFFQKSVEAW